MHKNTQSDTIHTKIHRPIIYYNVNIYESKITRRMILLEQEQLTFSEHLSSSPILLILSEHLSSFLILVGLELLTLVFYIVWSRPLFYHFIICLLTIGLSVLRFTASG